MANQMTNLSCLRGHGSVLIVCCWAVALLLCLGWDAMTGPDRGDSWRSNDVIVISEKDHEAQHEIGGYSPSESGPMIATFLPNGNSYSGQNASDEEQDGEYNSHTVCLPPEAVVIFVLCGVDFGLIICFFLMAILGSLRYRNVCQVDSEGLSIRIGGIAGQVDGDGVVPIRNFWGSNTLLGHYRGHEVE
jgi:hypothetical protein